MNRLLPLLFCIAPYLATGQLIGGRTTFTFLNLPTSARISALGGQLISVVDDDVNLGESNPALLNARMHNQLTFNHSFLLGNIQHGYAGYGHYIHKLHTTFHAGVKYINYGVLEQTTEFFETNGLIPVKESAFVLGAAFPLDARIQIGVNSRFIRSALGTLESTGLSSDIGMIYQDTAQKISVAFTMRHLGVQLSTYSGLSEDREPLPFEMLLGISKQLRYLPLRFSLVYENLQRWNILYDDPSAENGTIFLGEAPKEPGVFSQQIDNFFRHLVFSGELLLGAKENFRLRIAYKHRQRKELGVQGFGSTAGFSFGTGIKINRFRLDYGHSIYHLAGGSNHLGISTNLSHFRTNR